MWMGIFTFAKCWKFTTKQTFGYIINIYLNCFLKMDMGYDNFKDWT
jgi:hypothetical protein